MASNKSISKLSRGRAVKVVTGFLGSWLCIIIVIKIVTMVIRALSNHLYEIVTVPLASKATVQKPI